MSTALHGACQMISGQTPHPGDSHPALTMYSQLLADLERGALCHLRDSPRHSLPGAPQKLAGQALRCAALRCAALRCAEPMEECFAGGRALPGPMQRGQMMTTMTPPLETRSGMTSWPQRQAT